MILKPEFKKDSDSGTKMNEQSYAVTVTNHRSLSNLLTILKKISPMTEK